MLEDWALLETGGFLAPSLWAGSCNINTFLCHQSKGPAAREKNSLTVGLAQLQS